MNDVIRKLYPSSGLPRHWFGKTLDADTNMVNSKKEKVVKVLSKLPEKPIKAMIYGLAAPVVTELLQNGMPLAKIKGVDFPQHFRNTFEKKAVLPASSDVKVVFIYDVGLESAINTKYSQKLLLGLIAEYQNCNAHVFVQTDLSRVEFELLYEIKIASRIQVTPVEDENVFA